jgi:dihydropyrimidinase
MPLLIKNGRIVTADSDYSADIFCEGETITRIGRDIDAPPGTEVIDTTGKLVFPGFIDPHTHVYLPFMGTYSKDDYTTATKAALVGGTTTVFEMVCPSRAMDTAEGYATWRAQAEGKAACDYAFHMGVTKFSETTGAQLREIVAGGTASFKVFLAYKGAFGIDDTELYHTLKLARELGVIVTAHCENETLVAERQRELLAAGVTGPAGHHESRPPRVEAEGVHHLCTFAELTGASVYCVHTSCQEALDAAIAARARGVRVWIETLIQYLLLDKTYAERPDFEGAKYVMSPPLREARNQAVMWNALASGLVSTVATDHAPFDFEGQKPMGRDDFTKIPNGIPAIEDRVNLLYTHGVKRRSASIYKPSWPLRARTQRSSLASSLERGRSPSEATRTSSSMTLNTGANLPPLRRRRISTTTPSKAGKSKDVLQSSAVRGEVAVRDGKFVGTIGRGRFLQRQPTHGREHVLR